MSAVDRFDPEILALFTAAANATTENPEFAMPERGDALGLRSVIDVGLAVIPRPDVAGVSTDSYWVERRNGAGVEVRWYSRDDDARADRAAIVYFHGGGRVAGTIDHYDGVIRHYVQETNVPMCWSTIAWRRSTREPRHKRTDLPDFNGSPATPRTCAWTPPVSA